MPGPSYLPEAVPTALGWAHPLTGEQLDNTKGLDDAVDYYKPNSGARSFIDPEGDDTALIFSQKLGDRRFRFAVHAIEPVEKIEWKFGASDTAKELPATVTKVFPINGNYAVSAVVTFVDEDIDPETLTVNITVAGNQAPTNTAAPVITGKTAGSAISVNNGTWVASPTATYTYAWFERVSGVDTPIAGQTTNSWTPNNTYVGKVIVAQVTATNTQGRRVIKTAPVTIEAA